MMKLNILFSLPSKFTFCALILSFLNTVVKNYAIEKRQYYDTKAKLFGSKPLLKTSSMRLIVLLSELYLNVFSI